MTTVKIKASEEIVQAAAAEFTVTDARERAITIKKPGILAQYRLIETLGESAKNEVYTSMVLPLIYVVSIDGDMVVGLRTKREVEALIQRLDEDGVAAVMRGVQEHFGVVDPEANKESIKK